MTSIQEGKIIATGTMEGADLIPTLIRPGVLRVDNERHCRTRVSIEQLLSWINPWQRTAEMYLCSHTGDYHFKEKHVHVVKWSTHTGPSAPFSCTKHCSVAHWDVAYWHYFKSNHLMEKPHVYDWKAPWMATQFYLFRKSSEDKPAAHRRSLASEGEM